MQDLPSEFSQAEAPTRPPTAPVKTITRAVDEMAVQVRADFTSFLSK
jgi:hypothetical protein